MRRSLKRGHLASVTDDLDEALALVSRGGGGSVIGLVANAAAVYGELAGRKVVPDVVTDLTAAHDAVLGYCPVELSLEQWRARRGVTLRAWRRWPGARWAHRCRRCCR